MPVKWTPDNDQLLLLKILETHDISVDAKKISTAWPSEKGEVPTARAITERLVKIRQLARANGAGHFGISSSQAKSSSGKPGTPRKPLGALQSTPIPRTPTLHKASGYDARVLDEDDGDVYGSGWSMSTSPSKRKHDSLNAERTGTVPPATMVKVESIETDGFEVMDDGSAFSSATRSPGGNEVSRMRSVAGNARAMSQLHMDDEDASPTKRLRVGSVATGPAGSASGDEWGARRPAPSMQAHSQDDDDDDYDDAV